MAVKRHKVSSYTDTSLGLDDEPCKWIVRYGNGVKYFAFTTCKRGFNPLRGNTIEQIKEQYESSYCPICGRPITLDTWIVEDD